MSKKAKTHLKAHLAHAAMPRPMHQPLRLAGYSGRATPELKVADTNTASLGNGESAGVLLRNSANISTTVDSPAAQATHQIACLNTMAQGTDFTGRVGRKILPKSVLINMIFNPNFNALSSAGLTYEVIRIILFWDFQSNGNTTFTLANLLLDQGATPLTNTSSPVNLQFRDRFKILIDKKIVFDGCSISSGGYPSGGQNQSKVFKKYIKLGNVSTTFNDTGSAVYGDVQSGALMMAVFTENDSTYRMQYTARVRFIDS